jgi:type II secretory pathway pseudopilin PulG
VLRVKSQTLQITRCEIRNRKAGAFSLPEVVAALMILAFISTGVLVVLNRCVASAADSALRMQAFEVARENMEKLLTADSVKQISEFGISDKYLEIKWQTVVENFYEPITERVWVRGVCSAEYTDSAGEIQTVELTHWLTDVTKQQLIEILKQQQEDQEQLAARVSAMVINTIEEAAEYAGVDVETVEQWIDNGMLTTEDGSFVKQNVDIFKESDGNPAPEVKIKQVESIEQLTEQVRQETSENKSADESKTAEPETTAEEEWLNEIEPLTGLTYRELEQMDFWEIWELLTKLHNEGKF